MVLHVVPFAFDQVVVAVKGEDLAAGLAAQKPALRGVDAFIQVGGRVAAYAASDERARVVYRQIGHRAVPGILEIVVHIAKSLVKGLVAGVLGELHLFEVGNLARIELLAEQSRQQPVHACARLEQVVELMVAKHGLAGRFCGGHLSPSL